MNWNLIKSQLVNFLQTEVANTGAKGVVVGISGGLDSAVVAILCKEAFGENVTGVLMPSQFSNDLSAEHAKELCAKFNIKYETISIAPMVEAYASNVGGDKLRLGNFSARMRMAVLYDVSAREKALVVGTSNKSEILLGYGTIFGDTACAINPIGEIYKSDEFEFARYLGVTDAILNKRPSADLWEGQADEDELGYTYKQMDDAMKMLFDSKASKEEVVASGHNPQMIAMILKRNAANAFKGKLPTIAKINWREE